MKSIYSEDHRKMIANLKRARLEANMDQKLVAIKLHRSQSYISKIESGQRRVDLMQLKEFARIYKKKIEYFLSI